MKKNLQRVTSVALASVMVLGMAGCGSSDEATTNDSATNENVAATEQQTAADTVVDTTSAAGMDGWTAFADQVTLTIPVYDRGAEGIDAVGDNALTQWVNENFGAEYNVNVVYQPITRSDVMTDYALLAASDSLPTILMEYDYPKVTQWANDGYLQPVDLEKFAEIAPTYYNRMVDLEQLKYSTLTVDGSADNYFVFAERPYYDTTYTYCTFVRMDWLKQVGYDHVPASYQEYCDAMDKIMEEGIAEHPAGGSMVTAAYVANYGFRDYPVDEEEWAMNSSLSIASLSWEPTYQLIKRANEEFNKGYTNPEYYTTDGETAKAAFVNGQTYSYGGYMSKEVDFLTAFYDANPDAELAIASNYGGVDGEVMEFPQLRSDNPYGMTIGFGSSATEEELQAAYMYLEWCTQPEVLAHLQGTDGEDNGFNNFNNSKDYWCCTIESVKMDTIEETIAAIAPEGLPQDFTQAMVDNYYELREIADAGHAYTDPAFGVTIASESEYSATLLSQYIEYYDDLVTCDPAEFDDLYATLSQEYLDAGYQEILDERQAAYQAGYTTKLPWNY